MNRLGLKIRAQFCTDEMMELIPPKIWASLGVEIGMCSIRKNRSLWHGRIEAAIEDLKAKGLI